MIEKKGWGRRFVSKLKLERLEARDVPGETFRAVLGMAYLGNFWSPKGLLANYDSILSTASPEQGDGLDRADSDRAKAPLTEQQNSLGALLAPFDNLFAFAKENDTPTGVCSSDRPEAVASNHLPSSLATNLPAPMSDGPRGGLAFPENGLVAASATPASGALSTTTTATKPVAEPPLNGRTTPPAQSAGALGTPTGWTGAAASGVPSQSCAELWPGGSGGDTSPIRGDAAEPWTDGGGSDTSPIRDFSCVFGELTASDDLWYFGGGTITNYPTTITLTVSNIPAEANSVTWTVTNGYDKALFVGGSGNTAEIAQPRSAFSGSSASVQLTSMNYSDEQGDVSIYVNWSSVEVGSEGLLDPPVGGQLAAGVITISTAYRLMEWTNPEYGVHILDSPYTVIGRPDYWPGWRSIIFYQIGDQFGRVLPRKIFFNEYWASDVVLDCQVLGEQWQRNEAKATWANPAATGDDTLHASSPQQMPHSENPENPLGTEKYDHWTQEWRVGDDRPGHGWLVQRNTLQRYIDHGRHENIVEAHSWTP